MLTKESRPKLLMSGVTEFRSPDPRAIALTRRLVGGIMSAAPGWDTEVSWAVNDGTDGTLERFARADAVVVMGGPDVSPEYYGGSAHYPNEEPHFPVADEAQLALINAAVARNVPLVGICRGMQLLNISRGGTLVQDLDEPGHTSPQIMEDYRFSQHSVELARGSRLHSVLRSHAVRGEILVHSAHHQAVDRVGENLVVAARASDGVVEAVEHVSAPVVGVQWHPEDPYADPTCLTMLIAQMRERCSMRIAA